MMCSIAYKEVPIGGSINPVLVSLGDSIQPGMKTERTFLYGENANIFWKIVIEIFQDLRIGSGVKQIPLNMKMKHLSECMHSGICSAGTGNLNRGVKQTGKNFFYFFLNGIGCVFLTLPAVIAGAFVCCNTFI